MAPTKLYAVPASHPCAVVERAFEIKGIPFQRVDLIPITHVPLQKLRFGKRTVPGVVFEDGKKALGSREIVRELDRRVPEPRLVPGDPRVAAVEEWGEEVLQPLVRRVLWAALRRHPKSMPSYAEGARLPIPMSVAAVGSGVVARLESALNQAKDANVRADFANLHEHLDRIDRWIQEGLIGGEAPNAADLQIATGLRLLLTLGDVAPIVEAHRAADLARRWYPDYPGATPAGVLPAGWLPPLSAAGASSAATAS